MLGIREGSALQQPIECRGMVAAHPKSRPLRGSRAPQRNLSASSAIGSVVNRQFPTQHAERESLERRRSGLRQLCLSKPSINQTTSWRKLTHGIRLIQVSAKEGDLTSTTATIDFPERATVARLSEPFRASKPLKRRTARPNPGQRPLRNVVKFQARDSRCGLAGQNISRGFTVRLRLPQPYRHAFGRLS